MKFSLTVKKSESSGNTVNVNKININAVKNVSSCFSPIESDIKPIPKKKSLGFDDNDSTTTTSIAKETKPIQLKIDFKETEEPIDDPILTQYDEFINENKENDIKPHYINLEDRNDPVKIKERPKPRYIEKLVKTAQKREIERDLIIGKKEREAADGEAFVTSAYRKKLEEREQIIRKMMEDDKLDEIEAKNKNLSSLHKNMLESERWKRRHI